MNFFFLADEQRQIVAYLDSVQARLVAVREVQSATGEELDALHMEIDLVYFFET